MTGVVDVAVLAGYVLLMSAVGLSFARRRGSAETFYLADRTLGTGPVFGTTFSTFLGTGLVFTLATFGYRYGVSAFVLVGAAFVGFVFFALAAPRIKATSDQEGAITLPALMANHWSDRTVALASLVTGSLFAGTLAANFLVVGTVLQVLFEVPPRAGIAVFAALVVGYTVLGGFHAVLVTDLLQMAVIVVSTLLVLPALVLLAGDATVFRSLPADHLDPLSLPARLLVVYLLVGVFAFFGSQDLFQRVYAARGPDEARRGMFVFAGALVVMGSAAVGLGITSRALLPGAAADRALVALIDAVVPTGLVGAVLLGLLGLANSDADSQLLTVASNVTHDVLPRFDVAVGPDEEVWIARLAVAGIGAAALLISVVTPTLTALFSALGSWFAILGFVVVATLYWERTTEPAAFSGLAVGYTVPVIFVVTTGNVRAAPIVGLLPSVVVLATTSLLAGHDVVPNLSAALER